MPVWVYEHKKKDLVWQKFNRLLIVWFDKFIGKYSYRICKCYCGNECSKRGSYVRNWHIKSCWCLLKEGNRKTHWMRNTKFYWVRDSMRERCKNTNNQYYKNYWWRWITYEPRRDKFENFRDDMYESYLEHKENNSYTSIERENNDGNYCKENCRWATKIEQEHNKRNTITFTS
jgi:hypothetical protein